MKSTISLMMLTSFYLLFSYDSLSAQNYYLYNTNTMKTREISRPVRIKTSNGKSRIKLKGDAQMLNDSILAINDTTIHVSNIVYIQTLTHTSRQNGIILSVISGGLIAAGTVFAIQSGSASGLGVVGKVGLSILTYFASANTLYHAIENLFFGTKYRSHTGWTIKQSKETIITPTSYQKQP